MVLQNHDTTVEALFDNKHTVGAPQTEKCRNCVRINSIIYLFFCLQNLDCFAIMVSNVGKYSVFGRRCCLRVFLRVMNSKFQMLWGGILFGKYIICSVLRLV